MLIAMEKGVTECLQSNENTSPKRHMYFATFGTHSITVRQMPDGLAHVTRKVHGHPDPQLGDAVWVSPDRSMEEWVSIQEHSDLYTLVEDD